MTAMESLAAAYLISEGGRDLGEVLLREVTNESFACACEGLQLRFAYLHEVLIEVLGGHASESCRFQLLHVDVLPGEGVPLCGNIIRTSLHTSQSLG